MEAKLGPKSLKNRRLGSVWEVLAAPRASREASADKAPPKRRPKCSQDGPRCSQRGQLERTWGPSWRQDGGMMANLPPRWRHAGQLGAQDGQLGSILGAILAHLGHLGANFNENVEKPKKKPPKTCLKNHSIPTRFFIAF